MIVPKFATLAFANSKGFVVVLVAWAAVALLFCDVPECCIWAFHALLPIENWSLYRAVHALLYKNVINLILWATQTFKLIKIKVPWMVAFNAGLIVEESILFLADALVGCRAIHPPSRTLNTVFKGAIPILR